MLAKGYFLWNRIYGTLQVLFGQTINNSAIRPNKGHNSGDRIISTFHLLPKTITLRTCVLITVRSNLELGQETNFLIPPVIQHE